MSLRVSGIIGISMALAVAVISPILVSSESYKRALNEEIEMSVQTMGYEHSRNAVNDLKRQYEAISRFLHLEEGLALAEKGLSKLPHRKGKLLGAFDVEQGALSRAVGGPIYSLYLMCWRIDNYLLWLGYVLPILAALVFDGLMKRKIMAANDHYWSPSHYNVVWHLIIGAASLALISIGLAVAMPAVIYPLMIVLMGLLLRSLLANLQVSA